MSNRRRIQRALEIFNGILSLLLAHFISVIIFGFIFNKILEYSTKEWKEYFIILFLSFLIMYTFLYSPINLLKRSVGMELVAHTRNCIFTYSLFGMLLVLSKNLIIESRYLFISSFFLYFAISLAGRYLLKKIFVGRISQSKFATMCGVISNCKRAEEFLPRIKMDWSKNMKAIALLDAELVDGKYVRGSTGEVIESICDVPVVANKENLLGWIRTASLDMIYINIDTSEPVDIDIPSLIEELEDMGIIVNINIPSLENIIEKSKFDNLNCIVKSGYPMAVFSAKEMSVASTTVKRLFDIIGGIVGSIVSLPIILITAIPLKLDSPGPLIFKQQRVGKNGRCFNIYKLRSMYVDAEERKKELMEQNKMDGHMFKIDDDPRITKVGKFIRKYSIDELPQFWNVLKGDMSLVGTRPPTIDEFNRYESHHKRRLSMKPGITGKWQVSGRSDIQDFEEVVRLDCEYIDEWSYWTDIKILFKTVGVVLTHKGAE